VIHAIDTMGVLPVDCVDSVIFKVSLPVGSIEGNETLFRYINQGSDPIEVFLALHMHSCGLSNDPTIGRLDILSHSYYSALWAFERTEFTAEVDSVFGLAKTEYQTSRKERWRHGLDLVVHPNPASDRLKIDMMTAVPSGVDLFLYSSNGEVVWRHSSDILLGGQKVSVDVQLLGIPGGAYVLIPIVNGRVYAGEIINILK
jgi:hypothetical protein